MTADLCTRLGIENPWPMTRPVVPVDPDEGCFGTAVPLMRVVTSTMLVLELGSWLGASTRFFARHARAVIAVDHWRGSPEHQPGGYAPSRKLPTLYETFLTNCWEYRDRILPLRMTTAEGIALLRTRGVTPDLVYVDADHSHDGCMADLVGAAAFGPTTILTGDDFDYAPNAGVKAAVVEYATQHGLGVASDGNFWMLTRP